MSIVLNHLNLAILREIASTATAIADKGIAGSSGLLDTYDYIDADTLTMVLHEIREQLGDMDESYKER